MNAITLDNIKLPVTADLVYKKEIRDFIEVEKEAPLIIRDNQIICSGEESHSYLWLDYYGEYRGNLPWINEKLEEWAKENFGKHAYWEWNNPGEIALCI